MIKLKQILSPHAKLDVPETWGNVKEFADWWINAGMPIIFDGVPEIYVTDDATAVHLFRKKRFQLELYLIHPKPVVSSHEHPDVEVITMNLTGQYLSLSEILVNGESHGARSDENKKGIVLFAFQHWLKRDPVTVSAMWKGKTIGPLHESLIKKYNPYTTIDNGYVDTSQTRR